MDKIQLLKERKEQLISAGQVVRREIAALCDEDSFVELAAFSFSKDLLNGEEAQGEGIVTGIATIGGYPFCIVAQNFEVMHGGLSKAGCNKIVAALDTAVKQHIPAVYLLHSQGVRVGEGVDALEGIAGLLRKASELKRNKLMQFAVCTGEVYGSSAALAGLCDAVFFTESAVLALNSPFVLSAKAGKNGKPAEVGGFSALSKTCIPAVQVKGVSEAASKIVAICGLVSEPVVDAELNEPAPALNTKPTREEVQKLIEGGVELGGNGYPEVRTVLGRMGGIAVAAAVFDGATVSEGVLKKVRRLLGFAERNRLPFVTLVNCGGAECTLAAQNSTLLIEIEEYLSALAASEVPKLALITGRAVGLAYSLFAAKSAGFDYTFAFATAEVALFESGAAAQIAYPDVHDPEKLVSLYEAELSDPFHAARGGYLDNVIEPQFAKQYLVAALQTALR